MEFKSTIQHRFNKKRYRIVGIAAGFCKLAGINDDDRFNGTSIVRSMLLLPLFYKEVESLSLATLTREKDV